MVSEHLPYKIDAESIAKRLHIDDDEDMLEEFQSIFDQCVSVANPKICYAAVSVKPLDDYTTQVGSFPLKSRVLRVNFADIDTCIPYVCTCGRELYNLYLAESDPLVQFWIDNISEAILRSAFLGAKKKIQQEQNVEALYAMNPGSLSDFPIANQKPLFAMLGDVFAQIGVQLTDTFLMLPHKTVSGLFFASDTHYQNCALCPRNGCIGRRAAFDENLFKEKYAL